MGFCRWTISYKKQQVFNPAKLLECIKKGKQSDRMKTSLYLLKIWKSMTHWQLGIKRYKSILKAKKVPGESRKFFSGSRNISLKIMSLWPPCEMKKSDIFLITRHNSKIHIWISTERTKGFFLKKPSRPEPENTPDFSPSALFPPEEKSASGHLRICIYIWL